MKKQQRLQFSKKEVEDSEQKPLQEHTPKESNLSKPKSRLCFDHTNKNIQKEKLKYHPKQGTALLIEPIGKQVREDIDTDNVGVESAVAIVETGEVLGQVSSSSKTFKGYQKRKMKRKYALERYANNKNQLKYSGLGIQSLIKGKEKIVADVKIMLKSPNMLIVIGILCLLVSISCVFLSSCSMLLQGSLFSIVSTSYPSENEELIDMNNRYIELEKKLQRQIDEIEHTYPNYDEYHYQLDAIIHDPHELASYLTAKLQYFYADAIQTELEEILQHQYKLIIEEVMETRYRIDEETGEEIAYEYHILNITLKNDTIDQVARELLSDQELERYEIYLQTKGNKPFLFDGGTSNVDSLVDLSRIQFIEGERAGDANIAAIALSQVGNIGGEAYWSWYGFDHSVEWCACFVSWVLNQAGHGEPKFAACQSQGVTYFKDNGIWENATYSSVATGDVVFFDWDSDNSADHVGVVIGSDGDFIYTVEGNSGDACVVRNYAVDSSVIMGYGIMK